MYCRLQFANFYYTEGLGIYFKIGKNFKDTGNNILNLRYIFWSVFKADTKLSRDRVFLKK